MSYNATHAPATPLVLARTPDEKWLLINRLQNQVAELSSEEAQTIPAADAIIRTPSQRFIAASIEPTETCNLHCVHCYLGDVRHPSKLDSTSWMSLLDTLEATGIIWLQFTGGEPLSFPGFADMYAYAWDRGFVITVLTNGLLLNKERYLKLFSKRPAFRISVSIYGASKESYEAITRVRGSWERFCAGLDAAQTAGLSLRLKVVELLRNRHELDAMRQLACQFGEEDVVYEIMPTLQGDLHPLSYRVRPRQEMQRWSGCEAGRSVFHVLSDGRATLCKVAREPSVSIDHLNDLPALAEALLSEPEMCAPCSSRARCGICPALFRILNASKPDACLQEVAYGS